MRIRAFSILAICLLSVSRAAHADTLILALTPTSGDAGAGEGSAILSGPLSTTPGVYTVYSAPPTTADVLEDLSFTIGGDTFTLSDNPFAFGFVTFLGGDLSDISFEGEVLGTGVEFLVTADLGYTFVDSGTGEFGSGTISAVAPEPSSVVLTATGLFLCCAFCLRNSRARSR